ncbi:MAG: DUF2029 domain-containing protein, partial [Bacteroidetes bacterium]
MITFLKKIKIIHILYAIFIIVLLIFLFDRARKGGDFNVFLYAGGQLSKGLSPYQPPFFQGLQYFYSPLFALILVPFSQIPYFVTNFAWLLLNIFFIYRLVIIFSFFLDIKILDNKSKSILWVSVIILLVRYLEYNIGMVQVTIFLLWICWELINSLYFNKNKVIFSLLLAFAINVKLMLLPLIPYLLFRNKIKHSIYVIFFFILFLFLPALFLGIEKNNYLLSEWWKVINPSNMEHAIEEKNGTVSLSALVPVFITETKGHLPINRNFINLSTENAIQVLNIIRLFFVCLTLAFLGTYPFHISKSKLHTFREISYICLVIPLIFPHQQKYAFIFVAPCIIYSIFYFITEYNAKSYHLGKNVFLTIAFLW